MDAIKEKKKEKFYYTKEVLQECMIRDNAILTCEYTKINRETIITFICKCGKEGSKNLRYLYKFFALCNTCNDQLTRNKTKDTCIKRYGVDNPVKTSRIRDKMKRTNMERYGVEYAMSNDTIKQKTRDTFLQKYGVEHVLQNEEIKDKIKETFLQKYGVDNPWKNEEIKAKIKDIVLQKYGVEHIMHNSEIKQKIKENAVLKYGVSHHLQKEEIFQKIKDTNMEKYGVEIVSQNKEIFQKIKDTNMEKYGVDCVLKLKEIHEKSRKTCLERYGVEYGNQNPEILNKCLKSSKSFKQYTFPSGEIRNIQGYEPFALNDLLKIYTEEDIRTNRKEVPRVKYTDNDKTRYYFPDIYIISQNLILEIKSAWTIKLRPEILQLKAAAVRQAGYNYEVWCYDPKGNRIEINQETLTMVPTDNITIPALSQIL